MKIAFSLLSFLTAALLAGCGSSRAGTASDIPAAKAATYKAGNGLQLSRGARELAGLKTQEVTARAGGPVAIPASAVVRTIKGTFVYVANGPWFLLTPVTLGAAAGEWLPVTDGLYEGDTVVVQGTRTLWLAEMQAVNGGVGCADGH